MKPVFKPGDKKLHSFKVAKADIAAFNGVTIHEVCSTFALAREIEWATRLFVLDMKEDDEEGIGTRLEIAHKMPAFIDELVEIEAVVAILNANALQCTYTACVGRRQVAEGITEQRILKKEKIVEIFSNRKSG